MNPKEVLEIVLREIAEALDARSERPYRQILISIELLLEWASKATDPEPSTEPVDFRLCTTWPTWPCRDEWARVKADREVYESMKDQLP